MELGLDYMEDVEVIPIEICATGPWHLLENAQTHCHDETKFDSLVSGAVFNEGSLQLLHNAFIITWGDLFLFF
nr:hypothetical transcript [Hymenolepis microstoma]